MTFKDLCNFIENKMRMSQIYQPLLIRSLIDSDGKATVRQLATIFNSLDESQLQYYEKCIKEMPTKVLEGHGVILYMKIGSLKTCVDIHQNANPSSGESTGFWKTHTTTRNFLVASVGN